MKRHIYLALAIAPLLLIAGYIAAGYLFRPSYNSEVFQLSQEAVCQFSKQPCVLKAVGYEITVELKGNELLLESSHHLGGASLGTADTTYKLSHVVDLKHWKAEVDPNAFASGTPARFVAMINGGHFIAEIAP